MAATIFKNFKELRAIEEQFDGPTQKKPRDDAEPYHRALVVEDNDNGRELLAGYLRVSGIDVDTAAAIELIGRALVTGRDCRH